MKTHSPDQTARMVTGYLTRREYDALVTNYPTYMADVWPKLAVFWKLNGPQIIGTREQITDLQRRVSLLTAIAELPC